VTKTSKESLQETDKQIIKNLVNITHYHDAKISLQKLLRP